MIIDCVFMPTLLGAVIERIGIFAEVKGKISCLKILETCFENTICTNICKPGVCRGYPKRIRVEPKRNRCIDAKR